MIFFFLLLIICNQLWGQQGPFELTIINNLHYAHPKVNVASIENGNFVLKIPKCKKFPEAVLLTSSAVQQLYDVMSKKKSVCHVELRNTNKTAKAKHKQLEWIRCTIEHTCFETIQKYWDTIASIAMLSEEEGENVTKITAFTEHKPSGYSSRHAGTVMQEDDVNNVTITLHCKTDDDSMKAFTLSEKAVPAFITESSKIPMNMKQIPFSPKYFYVTLNNVVYELALNKEQCTVVKEHGKRYAEEKRKLKEIERQKEEEEERRKIEEQELQQAIDRKSVEKKLTEATKIAMFMFNEEIPQQNEVKGCTLLKHGKHWLISSERKDISISLSKEDKVAIFSKKKDFYLIVEGCSYWMTAVSEQILFEMGQEVSQELLVPSQIQKSPKKEESFFKKYIFAFKSAFSVAVISALILLYKKMTV